MERPRTPIACLALLGPFLFAGPVWAACPVIDVPNPQGDWDHVVVPEGCDYMMVKMWGNGGASGATAFSPPATGGGGAAITAIYKVQEGDHFVATVERNHDSYHGRGEASVFHAFGVEKPLIIAAGGGGGGASITGGAPYGGAGGGYTGQAGKDAWHPNGTRLEGGGGGTQTAGGRGGAGSGGAFFNGKPGGPYRCNIQLEPPCGQTGGITAPGIGGSGFYGGGGGGGINVAGWAAGGGGGSSFVKADPRLVYERRYDGDRNTPGNAGDPDRNGAGQGGTAPSTYGGVGRIRVTFPVLVIDPEKTTRWKPMRSDEPMQIVFESPLELALDSAVLDITGPDPAQTVVAAHQNLQPQGGPAGTFRYKLPWSGPWTAGDPAQRLPAGNYKVVVKAKPAESGSENTLFPLKSAPYDGISLVEVVDVELCRDDEGEQCLDWTTPHDGIGTDNPPVGPILHQVPPQHRPGGGKRVFSESTGPGSDVAARVKVRARISPTLPPDPRFTTDQLTARVHFESFDVDDPATGAPDLDSDTGVVGDNRGSPQNGLISPSPADVEPGSEFARTVFETTTSPGDNYRVVASTSDTWLHSPRVSAQPSSTTGEMSVPTGAAAQVSPMLTVWRTLNLELESTMAPPPAATPPSGEQYVERNFIKGKLLRLQLQPDQRPLLYVGELEQSPAPAPPLYLFDGSPQIGTGGAGRFEKGEIVVGTGESEIPIGDLVGNGGVPPAAEFVKLPEEIGIPCSLAPAGLGEITERFIVSFDRSTNSIVLDEEVPSWPPLNGGQISTLGHSFLIVVASGTNVQVQGPLDLPFVLRDDDQAEHPFSPAVNLIATTDNPLQNPLAQAYVLPTVWGDPRESEPPPFQRNIRCTSSSGWSPLSQEDCEGSYDELAAQLASGRSIPPTQHGYWASYVQGAFQDDQLQDADPDESNLTHVYLGRTPGLGDTQGSAVYVETIRDFYEGGGPIGQLNAQAVAVLHELGHQFGLGDGSRVEQGIMGPDRTNRRFFNGDQLSLIRAKGLSMPRPERLAPAAAHAGTPCDGIDGWRAQRAVPLAREATLSLSLDRSQYVVGEPLEMSLSLQNTSRNALQGRFEEVHPASPLLRVDYRRDGRSFEPLDRNRRNFHRGFRAVGLEPGETRTGTAGISVDRGRDDLVLDEPGTYEFRARFCEAPGDLNAMVQSDVVRVTVVEAPDAHRDAWRELSPDVAQFAHWPRAGHVGQDVIEKGLDFVERFPDSPWSARVRRGLRLDARSLLAEKGEEGVEALRERFEGLMEAVRQRGEMQGEPPRPSGER